LAGTAFRNGYRTRAAGHFPVEVEPLHFHRVFVDSTYYCTVQSRPPFPPDQYCGRVLPLLGCPHFVIDREGHSGQQLHSR
jgi:hypothetical protein